MPGGVVLIVGSANVDLVVRTARLPTPGETVTGGRFARYSGGKGANQAVAAARMGARVHFVGAVGQDELGSVAIADLESEGVGVAGVARLADLSTGVALIVVADDGENQIAVAPGANAALNGPSVESAIAALELAVGDVFLANLEVTDEAILAGARAAARARLQLLINPAPARALPDELLKLAPILLPNEVEAEALTGERDPVEAARAGRPNWRAGHRHARCSRRGPRHRRRSRAPAGAPRRGGRHDRRGRHICRRPGGHPGVRLDLA